MDRIVVKGAREHNLKGLDVELPRGQLVVITGLSGSGKSSLAFDTIYAEGQRRYVESLSVHARQLLGQAAKPDVDSIEGLSPAIAIEQRGASRNPRSTVGTITEIYDHLRLLFARIGQVHCPTCGRRVVASTAAQIVDAALGLPPGTRFSVVAPLARGRLGDFRAELEELRRTGFSRVTIDGQPHDLSEGAPSLDPAGAHAIDVTVDRLVAKDGIRQRLADSIELAARLADGVVRIAPVGGEPLVFSERFACLGCGVSFPEITPRFFSFNGPQGACPACGGLGARLFFDPELIVPDEELSLREGAIEPWERRGASFFQGILESVATAFGIDPLAPWAQLPAEHRRIVLEGGGAEEVDFAFERGGRRQTYRKPFDGVIADLERRLAEAERRGREEGRAAEASYEALHDEFHRYMRRAPCEACGGARLRPESLHVRVGGRSIVEVTALPLAEAHAFLSGLALAPRERAIAGRVLQETVDRLGFLVSVGVAYLSLDRPAGTLSGGEAQRVRLATQIGASLVGVIYILDEPSIGLHPRDHGRLLETLRRLRDAGNTVIVVEHDEETIRAADTVVDLGPRAGVHGGELVACGPPAAIAAAPASLTGAYLSGRRAIPVPARRRPVTPGRRLTVRGARGNNLKGIDVAFPLGVLTCVTGVSGSGKSTLVIDTLLGALARRLGRGRAAAAAHDGLEGAAHLDKVIDIDGSPIGRTPRSNPATFTGIFALVRELFAALPESRARGYRAGRYSFNTRGGRCESCQGDGVLRIEMQFLPDVHVTCEACGGRRFNRETLEVRYKGFTIADVLDLTVLQASELYAHVPKIGVKLDALREVGLGYLTLGQAATSLSGGEAQRLKLAKELARRATGRTLYVLDEPTTGLHLEDVRQLLEVLGQLVDQGNSVIVIEHQLDVIKTADWVIDLGPEGGEGGGAIVAIGTPEEVARVAASHTGRHLRKVLG